MCLNCGCGDYWDKRGKETNITMDDIEQAAKGEDMSVKDTIDEMIRGMQQALKQMDKQKK